MQTNLKPGFRLGAWTVYPLSGQIEGTDRSVHVEPKVMEVLMVLAAHPGDVVERETLLRDVWGPRAAVSDEPLTRCIAELRRTFGDSRQTPTFIQTIPKRGYRLLIEAAPLAQRDGEGTQAHGDLPRARHEDTPRPLVSGQSPDTRIDARRFRYAAPGASGIALLGLLGLGAGLMLSGSERSAEESTTIEPNTIAVLPFVDMGDEGDSDYFREGLADEILTRLTAVDGLQVVARTSSFSFQGSGLDVRSIADRLRVAHVLEGSVRRSGDRLRINVQLIDAQRGYQVWSASYEAVLDDVFALQDEIATAVVSSLHDKVPAVPDGIRIRTPPPTQNLAAYELLLRGRQQLNRRAEEPLRRSIHLFQQAIGLDAGYGQAYMELAKAHALLPAYSSELEEEMFDLALGTLATGIQNSAVVDGAAQGILALTAYSRWDWIGAEIAFRQALEQAANDPDLLIWYSQFLASVGRSSASLNVASRAKDLDPVSAVANHRLAVALMWVDEDERALQQFRIAEELGMGATANPESYAVLMLRFSEYASVRPMLIGVQTMFARPTAWVDAMLAALASPEQQPHAIEAVARAEQARDIARKYLFGAWVYLGETDRALATALQLLHDRPSFDVEFLFSREARALRAHPRFGELVRSIGLHRYWDQFGWPEVCRREEEDIVCR